MRTHDWEISGMIHTKLLALAASIELRRWVVRGGASDSYLKPFYMVILYEHTLPIYTYTNISI